VQISRIQVRRGRSLGGSGLPQLASGELAWSLDTQELYIGSGSVAEGAPAVGNTKILTERDLTVQGNLLNLIQHIYKVNDPAIQTGPTSNDPVSRQTQDRLDDRVTATDFGAEANGTTDDTLALQRAIDQLFLNSTTKASVDDADGTKARVILDLGPGIYNTTSTLYIPSYATLVGAGPDKTIISYTGVGPAIQFVNDSSTPGNPSTIGNTTNNNQPRHIIMKGFSIESNTDDQTCLQLDAVKESHFEDMIIRGSWNGIYDANSKGIAMHAVSAIVTCQNNMFNRISITGFSHAVYVKQDVLNNKFIDGLVSDCRQGFVLGDGADGTTVGQQYGPRETEIINFKFDNVKRHAVYLDRGTGNTTKDSKLTNVGNDGAGVYFPQYPQIYFGFPGNASRNDQSDREEALSTMSFTVDLELSAPITAIKGDTISQATSLVQGTLKQNYTSDTTITVVTKYVTPFNNFSNLTIDGDSTPGDSTQVIITGSSTTAYTVEGSSGNTTEGLATGSPIKFTGTMGGVVANTTTYYVRDVIDGVTFTISNTLGGPARALSVSSGTMFGVFESTTHPTLVGDLTLVPYLPMVAGYGTYDSYSTRHVQLGYITSPSLVCTLPVSTTASGTPARSISYLIKYMYRSSSNSFTRHGTLTLVVDIDASAAAYITKSQLTDDYIVTGITEEDALLLEFSAVLLNETGAVFSGVGEIPTSIALRHSNTYAVGLSTDSGTFSYYYTAIQ
jgi:hypothetical protein